jgi:YD repeat-containing protein
MKFFVGIATIFLSLSSFGFVDMRNANYSNTWIDIQVDSGGYDMKVLRTYHSRSLFNGMFGFGWCSNFETSLEILPEGQLKVRECGSGAVTAYSASEVSKADVDKVIAQIIAKEKTEKKVGVSEDYYKKLATELYETPTRRIELAAKHGIKANIADGSKFFANGEGAEYIQKEKDFYTRHLLDGTMQRFDKDGSLAAVYDKNNKFLKYKYEKGLLKEVEDDIGRKMTFKYYSNGKVKEITAPGGMKAEYEFKNLDDLASVKNAWKNTFKYEYDDVHNLTKAIWPDKTFITLTYNKKEDWVVGLQHRDKCVESYKYESSKSDPQFHYWADLKKVCGKKTVAEDHFEFWHKQKPDGSVFLQRLLTKVGSVTTDITYDDQFGKPLSIRKNADKTTYEYFPNGLVKVKAAPGRKFTYDYNQDVKKVSQVTIQFFNDKGEKVGTKTANFKYDPKGNLLAAQNSDGQTVNMTYDNKGRILTITDQAKKVVKIEYEDRFGKPFVVTRPGLGSIKINYDNFGEMKNVDSPEGPSVALQVASTFNNYLDILAPATQDVFSM